VPRSEAIPDRVRARSSSDSIAGISLRDYLSRRWRPNPSPCGCPPQTPTWLLGDEDLTDRFMRIGRRLCGDLQRRQRVGTTRQWTATEPGSRAAACYSIAGVDFRARSDRSRWAITAPHPWRPRNRCAPPLDRAAHCPQPDRRSNRAARRCREALRAASERPAHRRHGPP
jgi:hypothetical protein